jgi:hypothetical protein
MRIPVLRFRVAAVLCAGVGSAAAGDLSWQNRVVEMTADRADHEARADFVFTNTSAQTVRIRQVATSCGCTAAQVEKKEIAPGESGTVRVVFTFEGRKGLQEKSVVLKIADRPPEVLALRVRIPGAMEFVPVETFWTVGEAADPRVVTARRQSGDVLREVVAVGTNFSARLLPDREGMTRFEVRPHRTDRPVEGVIRLKIADPEPRTAYYKVAVRASMPP